MKPAWTIGIDLGDRYCHACVLDGEGRKVEEARIRTNAEALREVVVASGRVRTHSPWISRLWVAGVSPR
jgi:predicted NBD/HSP70 family sugar kinase